MARIFGGVLGNTLDPNATINSGLSGRFTMSDQYHSRSRDGWRIVPLGDQYNPINTGPAEAWATGQLTSGSTYYWANVGNATVSSPKQYEFVRHDNKSWVKITDTDFSNGTASSANDNFNYTADGMNSSPAGWVQQNGDWYWLTIPASRDTEGWNNWDLGSIPVRYWRCTMHWAPMSNGNSIPSGHPDNDNPSSFLQNDTDFNSRSYGGGSNVSWMRFGIGGVQHQGHSELGWTSERQTIKTNIHTGDKSAQFASGVSRIGSGATGYWDLGSSSSNRIFRTSAGDESGAGGSEQHAWCPHEMWLSNG